MLIKRGLSMKNLHNRSKTPLKVVFHIKIKFEDNIGLFKQKQS